MTIADDINAKQDQVLELQAQNDMKLDQIKAYIMSILQPIVTPEQLQAISDKMDQIISGAAANLAETDALDEPAAP